jgi:hypothetical protein
MSKSSTSITMKVLKLDDKVKAINIWDGYLINKILKPIPA